MHSDNVVPVCRDYVRGACTRGDTCPYLFFLSYLHSSFQLPTYSFAHLYIAHISLSSSLSCIMIIFDNISYHHVINFQATDAEFCRDFKKGVCTRGATCPYVHVPEYPIISHSFSLLLLCYFCILHSSFYLLLFILT